MTYNCDGATEERGMPPEYHLIPCVGCSLQYGTRIEVKMNDTCGDPVTGRHFKTYSPIRVHGGELLRRRLLLLLQSAYTRRKLLGDCGAHVPQMRDGCRDVTWPAAQPHSSTSRDNDAISGAVPGRILLPALTPRQVKPLRFLQAYNNSSVDLVT